MCIRDRLEAGRELTDSEISQHYSKKALAWAAEEPAAFLRHLLWKLRLFWTNWELGNNQEIRFFALRFNPLLRVAPPFALLAGAGLVGMALAILQGWRRHFPLWAFVLVYMASVVAFFVCSRFRVPVLPLLMIFSGHALAQLWALGRERRFGPVAALLVPALLIGLASTILPRGMVAGKANGLAQLALAEARAGQHDKAIALFEEGLSHAPSHRYLRTWLAHSLTQVGEQGRAMRLLDETLEDYPDQPEALAAWLDGAFLAGRYEQVLQRSQAALSRNRGLSQVHYQLGRACYALQEYPRALTAFQEARRQDPSAFSAPYAMGKLLLEVYQDREGALEAFEAALANQSQGEGVFVQQAKEWIETLQQP